MTSARFDRLARFLATPIARRATVLGGVAALLAGVGSTTRPRHGATRQVSSPVASPLAGEGATPLASPGASPGPLDLLAGTPHGAASAPQSRGGTCKQRLGLCAPPPPELEGRSSYWSDECCTNTCVGYRTYLDPTLRWVCA